MRPALPGSGLWRRLRGAIATRWLDRHVPRESTHIRLHRRRLFILPTGLGYLFALTLALLLLGSLNYGTSLGFAVTFLLVGAGSLAMVHTYRNLDGVELVFGIPPPVFAGEAVRVPVRVSAPARPRWSVTLSGGGGDPATIAPAPQRPATTAYRFAPQARGRFRPPRLRVTTIWPFALLRVWSWIWPRVEVTVYPACVDHGRTPAQHPSGSGHHRRRREGEADFAGLRDYHAGDSPRRIAWAVLARRDELAVKAFEGQPAGEDWFDWAALAQLEPEARLEQLCYWVVQAEARGGRYGLALPGARIEPGQGPQHRARCLQALADHRDPTGAAATGSSP